MTEETIFTKIIRGDIPSHKIYEDERTVAFLDIHPVAKGHVLVVPKRQIEFVWDLPDDDYLAVMATVQRVALRQRDVFGTPYVGEMVVGTDVPHAHVHVVPFTHASQLKRTLEAIDESEPDHEALSAVAEKLRF